MADEQPPRETEQRPTLDQLTAVVAGALTTILEERGVAADEVGPGTVLFGAEGARLDSIGLVTLVAEVEARVAEELGRDVVLADERAMSRGRSPYRTVGSLAAFAEEVLRG